MKEYPKILSSSYGFDYCKSKPCIAFDKLDGSNLRFAWNHKLGWHQFGTRNHLFDASHPVFGPAIEIFLNKYSNVEQIIKGIPKHKAVKEIIVYCEFFGVNSFAGQHSPNDIKDLVMFDVNVHKCGFIAPDDFLSLFSDLQLPKVIYKGECNEGLIEDVRNGVYPVNEGVIIKGGASHQLWMRKVKTRSYLQKLKDTFGDNWIAYWE